MTEEFTIVTRDIDVELTADELWELVGDGEGWAAWLVDEAAVEVAPDGGGDVVESGERRHVDVIAVSPGESVHFVWWPDGDDGQASSVSLTIDENEQGNTVLRVIEVFPPVAVVDPVSASIAWDVRAIAMWARCSALARL